MAADRLKLTRWLGQPHARDGDAQATRHDQEREREQIQRARHDPAAFAPLYEAYVDLVWRYALSRLGNPERAADATSQTFARAMHALPQYEIRPNGDRSAFRAWLMTIARNVVIDEIRQLSRATSLDTPANQVWLTSRERSPEDTALASAEGHRIYRALAQLPDTQRAIVELRAAGLKGSEIADQLGMSLGAVKTANHRAYRTLRDLLRHDPKEDTHR